MSYACWGGLLGCGWVGRPTPWWLVGDHLDQMVSWKGETDLVHEGEGPISLGFRIRCGEFYGVEFKDPE